MLKGFKEFLFRGNIVDLAVAVVIGSAFAALVKQLGDSFINPLVKAIGGGGGGTAGTFTVHGVVFDFGAFITATVNFLITAAVVYFLVVLPTRHAIARSAAKKATIAEREEVPADVVLLTEIRDLLRSRSY